MWPFSASNQTSSNKATVLRSVTEDYLKRTGVDIKPDHGVDHLAMAISLIASTRGLSLMPAYAQKLGKLPGAPRRHVAPAEPLQKRFPYHLDACDPRFVAE